MSSLQTVKFWLVENVHLAKDALHIYVGLAVLLGSALVFRWPLRNFTPWLAVFVVTVLGEAWDMIDRMRMGVAQFPAGQLEGCVEHAILAHHADAARALH